MLRIRPRKYVEDGWLDRYMDIITTSHPILSCFKSEDIIQMQKGTLQNFKKLMKLPI